MSKIVEAVYEKGHLRPLEQVQLEEGQTIKILVPERAQPAREARDQRLRRHFGMWQSGDRHSADNDRIDADLARIYAVPHEPKA